MRFFKNKMLFFPSRKNQRGKNIFFTLSSKIRFAKKSEKIESVRFSLYSAASGGEGETQPLVLFCLDSAFFNMELDIHFSLFQAFRRGGDSTPIAKTCFCGTG